MAGMAERFLSASPHNMNDNIPNRHYRTARAGWLSCHRRPADAKSESVWGRRYRRRVAALIAAGYLIPAPGGVAPAGDTVEIVRVVDGRGHGHVAGVRIRASARFCAAHADNIPTRLSAARLFDGSG